MKIYKQPSIGVWIFLSVLLLTAALISLYFINDYSVKQSKRQEQDKAQADKKSSEDKASSNKNLQDLNRNNCLSAADDTYRAFLTSNAVDGRVQQGTLDTAMSIKQASIDNCYRQYPNN